MSLARVALHDLPSLPPRTGARVAGRVIHTDELGTVLCDASGNLRIQWATPTPSGSLVVLEGEWDGADFCVRAQLDSQLPLASPFDANAEFQRLQASNRKVGQYLTQRALVMRCVREYFDLQGFLEVETPLVVPSPGLDPHLSAFAVSATPSARFLITSPEYQMKRLLAGGLERIYQLAKCFRGDEVGSRHQPEFTMLEWYRAFAGVEDVMRDTEHLAAQVALSLRGAKVLRLGERDIDVTPPWPRITVREAFEWFAGIAVHEVLPDEDRFFRLLVESVEPALEGVGAVFLHEYPASMASLARRKPSDPSVAERFEAYVGGIELCNGFGELTCPVEQRARFEQDLRTRRAQGKAIYPIDERFLRALEEGMPPSAGNALGLDRLVMLALGAEHIEDVLAVPATRL